MLVIMQDASIVVAGAGDERIYFNAPSADGRTLNIRQRLGGLRVIDVDDP